jgi:hypothetical protein
VNGVFGPDAQGRRPGIYTYLAGPPNRWTRAKVDHNLRTVEDPGAVAGPFDAASVMLYRFAPFFYKSNPSPCAPTGNGVDLSEGDKRGLQLLYPAAAEEVEAIASQSLQGLELMGVGAEGVEETRPSSAHIERLVELMTAHAAV